MEGKVIIVTGGSAGIGAAAVRLFTQHSAKVVIADLDELKGNALAEELGKEYDVRFKKVDVSNFEQVQECIQYTVSEFGGLDVMVCNAGIANKKLVKTADHGLEEWNRVIDVNQNGVFYCMKLALQQMTKQGSGNIVNVASLAGLKASGNNLAYSASKFAVVGMTKSAALEYASKNIRVNCVCPSYTRTKLFEDVLNAKENLEARLLQYMPMKRFGKVEEIADAIYWLASDQSSFVTGQSIVIGGGSSL